MDRSPSTSIVIKEIMAIVSCSSIKESETPASFSMISYVGSPDKNTGMAEIATKNINQYDNLCNFLSIVRKAIKSSIPLKIIPMTGRWVNAM